MGSVERQVAGRTVLADIVRAALWEIVRCVADAISKADVELSATTPTHSANLRIAPRRAPYNPGDE